MDVVFDVARIALGAVLAAAGAAKLFDPAWRFDSASFGVGRLTAAVVGPAELLVGSSLAVGVWRPAPAVAALALLAAFTVVTMRMLAKPQGERPRCACFGTWSSKPISTATLLRNLALLALAALALFS